MKPRRATRLTLTLLVLSSAAALAYVAFPSIVDSESFSVPHEGVIEAADAPPQALSAPPIKPFRLNGTHFEVVRNSSVSPPVWYGSIKIDPANSQWFEFPPSIQSVLIEVGTNDEPDMGVLLKIHRNTTLIGFEPQPGVFTDMLRKFPFKQRLVAFPAAITPSEGFVPMHVSAHKGCSSLLNMNDKARSFAKKEGKKAPRKSGVIQLRTLEYCAMMDETIQVPSFPLKVVLERIPPRVSIDLLMIDAQGYDIMVASTIGTVGSRAKFVVLECQDLEPGHVLFLVEGAPSCHQQRQCFEAAMPHRLEYCWDNAPKVREYNCLYRHPDVSIDDLPKGLKIVSQPREIYYPTKKEYTCPTFLK